MSDRSAFNQGIIDEFRANQGRVGGPFANRPMLLLTTVGAKSKQRITVPLVYTRDGERIVVIASKGGAPTHPDWYHNLRAHPEVTLEIGTETFAAKATAHPDGAERDRLFAAQAAIMPAFADYEKKTTRKIPVVTFERNG